MLSNHPLLSIIAVELDGLYELPPTGLEIKCHIKATVDWIRRAHAKSEVGGISKGYDLLRGHWAPAYPETTGYTIPTLLNVAVRMDQPELHTLALSLADYLIDHATLEGGVIHWEASTRSEPVVFDTGQVIFGWLAAYRYSSKERYLNAATRAGDWLVSVQDRTGAWITNQHLNVTKVIDTRVAWALLELYQITSQDKYLQACVRNLRWAQKQQDPDGWFRHCSFRNGYDPFTHTLTYTAEGFLEAGLLLKESEFVDTARMTIDALLAKQREDGSLASTFGPGWRATRVSSCLTGNCQASLLWMRFFRIYGDVSYRIAAERAVTFVARTQSLKTTNLDICGGIAGSFPVHGRYERFKYPNWAAKYFVDALLSLDRVNSADNSPFFVG
jgi:uncharacterized protein YyaL (SSP411 family)